MDPISNSKAALNIWCSKKKLKVDYYFHPKDSSDNFQCDVTIQTFNKIIGVGQGTNKKLASNLAAFNALNYLVKNSYITEKELSQQCFKLLNIKEALFPTSNNNNNNVQINSPSSTPKKETRPQNNRVEHQAMFYNHPPPRNFPNRPPMNYIDGPPSNRFHGPRPNHFDGPSPNRYRRPPPNHFDDSLPNRFHGPPPNHFNEPPSNRFSGPPPNHFYGPQNYFGDSPPNRFHGPPPNNFNDPLALPPPFFPETSREPAYGHNSRMPFSSPFNEQSYYDNKRKNFRTRRPGEFDPDFNAGMRNLNINTEKQNNRSLVDSKKRKFDSNPNSIRHKLQLLQKECNFNVDNAKQQLNIFFQLNKIKTDYEYNSYGPPHSKTFIAKLKFYVYRKRKDYFAEEMGDSKQDASRLCALNILYQLYQDNLIQGFEPEAFSKRQLMRMSFIYGLNINSDLKDYLASAYSYIQSYNNFAQHLEMINPKPKFEVPKCSTNFLYWCPPLENFNPWTNSNLDGTYWAGKSKEDINAQLQREFQAMIKSQNFQEVLKNRMLLPIWQHKQDVIKMIESNPVVIIKGSTGCGKTTQVSQFILDSYIKAANGANCNIIVTQPRRISAISIAERVAFERCEDIKDGKCSVGYAVRFDHVYPRPYGSILFCTTGHLLRRIQGGLKGVSHLIIDEVHERDINTDLLLIIIRDLIQLDLNIRVIIMSATLGVSHFQNYFNCKDVFEIDSHLFPVTRYYLEETIEMIKWKPKTLSYIEDDVEIVEEDNDNSMNFEYPESISQNTINVLKELKEGVICFELILALLEYIDTLTITGSVLIFLPGWNSIFGLLNYLKSHRTFGDENRYLLLPLHSQLSHNENNRIFMKCKMRKIILSTNIAETSITINDVVFVIDTCLIKRKLYDARTNTSTYAIDWVSKSNIQQRQGRAGRVNSGYFFVLCTKKRFEMLEEFKKPEILVSSLVETSLLIKYLGFGSVTAFLERALDPPSSKGVEDALKTLRTINAFDQNDDLTPLGAILAKMPIDPKIGRMIIESILLNVAPPVITIAAASSINFEMFDHNDLELLLQTLMQLDEERYSDHLIVFKVFDMYEKSERSTFGSYRCININAINVVHNARKQLVSILTKCGFKDELFQTKASHLYSSQEFDIIAGLMVTAFYPNVCIHKDTRRILTNEERIGLIHKTSVFYSYVHNQKLSKTTKLKSPMFIYSEKSQNKNLISSKQMTMVSFLQLLLFGIKTFEYPPNNVGESADTVLLDGWIEIKIDPAVFDYILQLKSEFEKMITSICQNPEYVKTELDATVLNAIGFLCLFDNISVDIIGKPQTK